MNKIKFGDADLFCDETTLKLTSEENLKVFSSPISPPRVQTLGKLPRTLFAKAVHSAKSSAEKYAQIHALIGTTAFLKCSLCEMNACLYKVELSGEKNPDNVVFNFYFCEVV